MFANLNPLGTRDAKGVPVKTSPPRTEAEQAAIDEFIRRRGVTKVLATAESAVIPFGRGTNTATEYDLNRQKGRIRAMLMYLRDKGPANSADMARAGGYTCRSGANLVVKSEQYGPLFERRDGLICITEAGKVWLKREG